MGRPNRHRVRHRFQGTSQGSCTVRAKAAAQSGVIPSNPLCPTRRNKKSLEEYYKLGILLVACHERTRLTSFCTPWCRHSQKRNALDCLPPLGKAVCWRTDRKSTRL